MPKRARSTSPSSSAEVFESRAIDDRSSRFIAVYSPHLSAQDLQRKPDLSTATHRIAAWRQPSAQRSLSAQPVLDTGHDDDGEKSGGKTLEKVLVSANVVGAVVVARWYGGVMLGPVRFDHMRVCANEAIAKWKAQDARPAKQAKILEDDRERDRLVAVLKERDHSVGVLRELLAEKKGQAPAICASPAKVTNYMALPLPALEKLENVKDATIGWILKEIDKAEKGKEAEKAEEVEEVEESERLAMKVVASIAEERGPIPVIASYAKEENINEGPREE